MNVNEPAVNFFASETIETLFPVVSIVENIVTLVALDSATVVVGALFLAEGKTGRATSINGALISVLFEDPTGITISSEVIQLDMVSYGTIPNQVSFVPLFGSFLVFCKQPTNYKKGYIGWSFYKGQELIAIGNDFRNAGTLELNGNGGTWLGDYRLEISLFDESKSVLSVAVQLFSSLIPVSQFTAGGYNDPIPNIKF